MKALIIGIHLTGGVGKESGKPFQFAPKAYITAPIDCVDGEKYWRKGVGHEPIETELTDEAYNTLMRYKSSLPGAFEIETTFRKERIAGRDTPVMVICRVADQKAAA